MTTPPRVVILTDAMLDEKIAQIETKVPGIREAFERGYGDSCWREDVDWNPLCQDYESYRFLRGSWF